MTQIAVDDIEIDCAVSRALVEGGPFDTKYFEPEPLRVAFLLAQEWKSIVNSAEIPPAQETELIPLPRAAIDDCP